MPECMNTVSDFTKVREAVCVSARKIMDACRDQDCSEDVPVYLTVDSQQTLESATSVKARCAELLHADVEVEPIAYQEGYYCVKCQYYYRVIADAVTRGVRPVTIYGLATAQAQAMLYGGCGGADTFSSDGQQAQAQPMGVVEAVDPVVLSAHMAQGQAVRPLVGPVELPERVAAAFDDALVFGDVERQLQVTLGQFSLMRLERQTQLLIPSYDYCMPEKSCCQGECGCPENPCEAFARMQFPVSEFFPVPEGTGLRRSCACPQSEAETAPAPGREPPRRK